MPEILLSLKSLQVYVKPFQYSFSIISYIVMYCFTNNCIFMKKVFITFFSFSKVVLPKIKKVMLNAMSEHVSWPASSTQYLQGVTTCFRMHFEAFKNLFLIYLSHLVGS